MKTKIGSFMLLVGCLTFAGVIPALAQEDPPSLAQVVALDECDPVTGHIEILFSL